MSDLIVSNDGPIRTLRMNCPAKKNALTLAMYDAMAAAVEDSGTNGAIRCLLIAGGPGSFCAGNYIGEFMKAADEGRCHGDPLKLVVVPDHETVKAMAAIDVVAVHQQIPAAVRTDVSQGYRLERFGLARADGPSNWQFGTRTQKR